MTRYRLGLASLIVCLAGIVVYVFAVRSDWGEQLIARGYSLFTPKQTQARPPMSVILGAPGGTDLEDWGLKMVFLDGLQVERVWRWGAGENQRSFLVLKYEYGGASRWLVVAIAGRVSVREGSGGDSASVEPEMIGKALARGQVVQLSLLHRFDENSPPEAAREELIRRRAQYVGMSQRQAEREVGQFPDKAWSDQEIRELLESGSVVALDEQEFLLSGIRRL